MKQFLKGSHTAEFFKHEAESDGGKWTLGVTEGDIK